MSPKSAVLLKKLGAANRRNNESTKNIKQPPHLLRASSYLAVPSEQIGFTVRTKCVCAWNPSRVGTTAMQHGGFRVLTSNSASQAFLWFNQSLGWSPADTVQKWGRYNWAMKPLTLLPCNKGISNNGPLKNLVFFQSEERQQHKKMSLEIEMHFIK